MIALPAYPSLYQINTRVFFLFPGSAWECTGARRCLVLTQAGRACLEGVPGQSPGMRTAFFLFPGSAWEHTVPRLCLAFFHRRNHL
jgi:hypothetical protein